jgi:hypothetical protein
VRYTSADEDSGRWIGFPFRDDDIVISARSKSGTTWVQMICALLIFQSADLPGRLGELSPWLDHLIEPRDAVVSRLEAQQHRRFIKTHTPLDGIVIDPGATYVVVARPPLDMAVSLYHQSANIDRARLRALTAAEDGTLRPPTPAADARPQPRPDLHDWLVGWIHRQATPTEQMDSLPGVLHHLVDATRRARTSDNIVLLRYADLVRDLEGQMRHLAQRLRIDVPDDRWQQLAAAASFPAMRDRADDLAPNALGVLKDSRAFFRNGQLGDGRAVLTDDEYAAYRERARALAPDSLLDWLHA